MIFDHIGLVVRDLAVGRDQLSVVLPIVRFDEPIEDPLLNVRVQFALDGSGIRYELVAPFGPGSPVDGALASGRNILNHVAYRCATLDLELDRLRRARSMPLGKPLPAVAFGGRRVVFVLTALGFILELIDDPA